MASRQIDIDALRRRREGLRPPPAMGGFEKADWFRPEAKGYYYLYIAPPCEQAAPWPGVACDVHYKVGEKERTVVCLGEENDVLWGEDQALLDAIDARNERVRDAHPDWETVFDDVTNGIPPCPVCEYVDQAGDEQVSRDMGRSRVFYFNVALIKFVPEGSSVEQPTPISKLKLLAWSARAAIGDKILDFITVDGVDISDPNRAILVKFSKVKRGGKVSKPQYDVKYEVALDPRTSQKPMALPPPLMAQLSKIEKGGPNYVFDIIANQCSGHDRLREEVGLEAQGAAGGGVDEGVDQPPECYETSCDVTNDFCKQCPFKVPCAAACGVKWPPASPAARSSAPPSTSPSGRPASSSATTTTPRTAAAPVARTAARTAPATAPATAPLDDDAILEDRIPEDFPPTEDASPLEDNAYNVDAQVAKELDAELEQLMGGQPAKTAAKPAPAQSAAPRAAAPRPTATSGAARPRPTGTRA